MTSIQILRVVKAAVAADNIYVTANRIGIQHSTLMRFLFGQKIQERVAVKIAAFAEKPPKAGKAKAVKKPAKKAKAKKVSKKPSAKKVVKKAVKASKPKKTLKVHKPKKVSKPRAKKAPAAPTSGPTLEEEDASVDEDGAETAAE